MGNLLQDDKDYSHIIKDVLLIGDDQFVEHWTWTVDPYVWQSTIYCDVYDQSLPHWTSMTVDYKESCKFFTI